MSYIILYVFLAFLCLWNIRFAPVNADIEPVMNRLNKLRFIVAVLIVFTHCTLPYEHLPLILLPLRKVSTFGVGYFFLLSGYGLAYSVHQKPNYLHSFWKKIGNLLLVTVLSSIISTLIKNIALGKSEFPRLINWYMPAIIVLYLIFFAAYRIFPKSKNVRSIFLVGAVFVIISIICCTDHFTGQNHRNYYISELAFPFGVLIFEYADIVTRFLKKKSSIFIIALSEILLGVLALKVPEKGLSDLLFHNLMLMPFGLALLWFMDKVKIDNPILNVMNRYTLFIYLFQFPVLDILKAHYISAARPFDVFYFLGCLGLTCVLTVILQYLYDHAKRAVCKCLHQKS